MSYFESDEIWANTLLSTDAVEISLANYLYLKSYNKSWTLNRRGHRLSGGVFISQHKTLFYALKAYKKQNDKIERGKK